MPRQNATVCVKDADLKLCFYMMFGKYTKISTLEGVTEGSWPHLLFDFAESDGNGALLELEHDKNKEEINSFRKYIPVRASLAVRATFCSRRRNRVCYNSCV